MSGSLPNKSSKACSVEEKGWSPLTSVAEQEINSRKIQLIFLDYLFESASIESLRSLRPNRLELKLIKRFMVKKLFLYSEEKVKARVSLIREDNFEDEMIALRPQLKPERLNIQRRSFFTIFQKFVKMKNPEIFSKFELAGFKNKDSLNHHFYFRFFYGQEQRDYFIATTASPRFREFFRLKSRERFNKCFPTWMRVLKGNSEKLTAIHLPPLPSLFDSILALFTKFF